MLLHHIDVVPADADYWDTDPLSGEIRDGHVYGRGTIDTKSSGILHLAAFVALHRLELPLSRDVIFMATADEEAGGFFGVGWLVENRRELFNDVGYVINEGGEGAAVEGRVQFGIEVTQKVPYWLPPDIAQRARPWVATERVVSGDRSGAALERLREHEFEPRVVPAVDEFFKGIAPASPPEWRDRFADLQAAIRTPGVVDELQREGSRACTRSSGTPAH